MPGNNHYLRYNFKGFPVSNPLEFAIHSQHTQHTVTYNDFVVLGPEATPGNGTFPRALGWAKHRPSEARPILLSHYILPGPHTGFCTLSPWTRTVTAGDRPQAPISACIALLPPGRTLTA